MPSPTSSITPFLADYDAIERAIRETSRGRWFLACYLERNRSAETNMLLSAIGKLESAMRDGGCVIAEGASRDTLETLRQAFDQAREEIAYLPSAVHGATRLPLKRFNFESIPSVLSEETQMIREAAASIHSAAYALHAAGVFQGVARQMIDRTAEIERSCVAQETVLGRTARMARLLSEVEAELVAMFDDDRDETDYDGDEAEIAEFISARDRDYGIPEEVVEEISAALTDAPIGGGRGGFTGPAKR
ncbi:MAG: hypothetical protein HC850_04350 [Rhodomicrobium sp.]|nr:hypothetical protein [Rhodomicrobium sp.]